MFKEIVQIIAVDGDQVQIKFEKKAACSCCKASHICSVDKHDSIVIDREDFDLASGDNIEVAIEEKKSVLAAIITFLVPAALFLSLLILFRQKGEFLSFLLAVSAVSVYYIIAKQILKTKGKYFKLKIVRKV